MYGYNDKRLVRKTRLATYLVPLLILLIVLLLLLLNTIKLDNTALVAISLSLIGWPLAVDNIFLQINNSLKRKLETDAIKQVDAALVEIGVAFAATVTFSNDFVVQPLEPPQDLWYQAARDKWSHIAEETMKMRDAYGSLYRALEGNEIAIIHLEQYYRYLTIIIGDFIDHSDQINNKFLLATSDYHLSEEVYRREVADFKVLQDEWANVAMYCMDFRKMIQNELLGDVFKRQLLPRKPLPGHGTTLEKVATKVEVQRIIDERNDRLGLPKVPSRGGQVKNFHSAN